MLDAETLTDVVSSPWSDPFIFMQWPSVSVIIAFVLKSVLRGVYRYPSFSFWIPFAWTIFFCALIQSVCPSISSESVRPHADGSCSFIRLSPLCHVTAEVSPSSFKVITDRSVLTAILLISGSYVSFSLFLSPLGLTVVTWWFPMLVCFPCSLVIFWVSTIGFCFVATTRLT